MISLPNQCYCSPLKVHPSNWKTTKAPLKVEWYIYYRFYFPSSDSRRTPKGKLVRIKRMNKFSTLEQRQLHTQEILNSELEKLKNGYQPGAKADKNKTQIHLIQPTTPFLTALEQAANRLDVSHLTRRDCRTVINLVSKAAQSLQLDKVPIGKTTRRHIKFLLTQAETEQGFESAHRYNKIRTYLMILFKELVELEILELNPVMGISKRKITHPIRELLNYDERKKIDAFLKENHYRLWLFTHIFFHSASRLTEIIQVRVQDVNLVNQTFLVTIMKGKQKRQVTKTIKDVALPYWNEAMAQASRTDYIFSVGLKPGQTLINSNQITRRWNRHVKKKLSIQCDLYSLKHLNLDQTASILSLNDAAAMASHTSTVITSKHYTINEKERQNNRLKKVNNVFV